MRWTPGGRSPNLEDRRGSGMGMPLGIGGGIVTLILALIFGPGILSDNGTSSTSGGEVSAADSAREEPMVQFVSFLIDDVQATWEKEFPGGDYRPAHLVLFRGATPTACGLGQSAMGPFYCPRDEKVYLDLDFFNELKQRFGAPGDFAQAYVVAHEFGHHIQKLTGVSDQANALQQRNPGAANQVSVRLELQADCYAGVWAHSAAQRGKLETGDIEEGLAAASAVGDDRLQRQETGTVTPDSFTHGSSRDRSSWFMRGFQSGDPQACATFKG